MEVNYDDLQAYMDWIKTKSELKFNPKRVKSFPILYNCIYWAHMGCNIGSEEGKHRPVLITRTYKNSPICTVIPLTTQRLNDKEHYHVDLEVENSTALCEQMRIIDVSRIDKPLYKGGKIMTISENDWNNIDREIKIQYSLSKLPEQKHNTDESVSK